MDQIVRLDIGVMENNQGKLEYFINEVERGSGIALFLHEGTPEVCQIIDTWGEAMAMWMAREVLKK